MYDIAFCCCDDSDSLADLSQDLIAKYCFFVFEDGLTIPAAAIRVFGI